MHKAADRIRNVALVGHRGSGKTSLHEALLFQAGVVNRLGSVVEGTTVSDSDPDEKARQMSISLALSSFEWQERKVNLLDTPGDSSFIADALGALRVCESAVFVVNAVMGVEVHTTRLWQRAAELDLARLVFVNMLDRERADFFRTLDSLKSAFGQHVVATEIPIGSEHEVSGVIDLVDMKAYEYDGTAKENCNGDPDPRQHGRPGPGVPRAPDGRGLRDLRRAHGALSGGRGDLPRGDRHRAQGRHQPRLAVPGHLRRGHAQPRHQPPARRDRRGPALAGQARRPGGGRGDARAGRGQGAVRLRLQDPRRPVRRAHQHVPGLPGHDGPRHPGPQHHAPTARSASGSSSTFEGGHSPTQAHAEEFGPGDIGAVAKLKETRAGDWLAARDEPISMPSIKLPAPVMAFAIEPKAKGDEEKVFTVAAPPPGGGPDDRPAPRRADRRADRRRALPGPCRGDRRAPARPLRRRGDAQAAAGPLPGDDPPVGQGPRAPQEADRRTRPVRGLPHRDRADGIRPRPPLRVRRRDQGRGHPVRLHPRRREGRARGHAGGDGRRLPGQGRPRPRLRRLLPHRRLLGDGVQGGRARWP